MHGAFNSLQQDLSDAFTKAILTAVPELRPVTELDAKSRVISWWNTARRLIANPSMPLPMFTTKPDWLAVAGGTIDYVIPSLFDDEEINHELAEQSWFGAPNSIHVHLHLTPTSALFFIFEKQDQPDRWQDRWQMQFVRGILEDRNYAVRLLEREGSRVGRSLSAEIELDSTKTGRPVVETGESVVDAMRRHVGTWVERSTNPRITLNLLAAAVRCPEPLALAATENPDLAWYFGQWYVVGPASSWITFRSFPGFYESLQQFEPDLGRRLDQHSYPIPTPQITDRDLQFSRLIRIELAGGFLPA
jgi:hypothetical protein